MVRGKTYTFVVEGGHDPEVSAKYHPFYITDDPVGGYEYKTLEEKKVSRKLITLSYYKFHLIDVSCVMIETAVNSTSKNHIDNNDRSF